jgi:hypothetical protein
MAKLKAPFDLSGSLGNLSFYMMEGVNRTLVREKGGASKEKILYDPVFENTRRNMGEFGGRGPATHAVLEAIAPLRPGHGVTGTINKLLTALQKMDSESPWGQRAIAVSRCPQLLQGLNISKRLTLEGILKNDLLGAISREGLTARVEIPPLIPMVNCIHPKPHTFYRVLAVLGIMPDLFYGEELDRYLPEPAYQKVPAQYVATPWEQTNTTSEASSLEVTLPQSPEIEGFSMLLTIAIQYGKLGPTGIIEPVPKAVASKIIAVA